MKQISLAVILFLFIITGCSSQTQKNVQKEFKPIESIFWDTSGGGACKFSVKKESNLFSINITSWSFQALTKKITVKESDPIYLILNQIFNNQIDLSKEIFIPQSGATTGTWTSITIQYSLSDKVKIENIQTRGPNNLSQIYDFVGLKIKE